MRIDKDVQGFVLFTTMIFLVVLSLFLLSLLQMAVIDIRASAVVAQRHKTFDELERLAAAGLKSFKKNPECVIRAMSIAGVHERLKQHQGCQIQTASGSVWVLIQDLGVYPCLQIQQKNRFFSSHHWEVTLARFGKVIEVMQWRHVVASHLVPCEGTQLSTIPFGNVSWRHLRIYP